jgi:hypothetical protein
VGWLDEAEKKGAEQARARAAAEAQASDAEVAKYRQSFVGHWVSVNMQLTITPDGSVDYKRLEGGSKRSITGTIHSFRRDGFDVSVLGIKTTFRIDRPPHDEGGARKMTIDGVELTRER